MSPILAIAKILVLFLSMTLERTRADVQCNSTTPGGPNGVCTGHYCFNIENQITGCVNFYRQIRDDNIACGHMHLLGKKRKTCVCTQAYCTKYNVDNMPMQTLANVTCTDDTSGQVSSCTPGPCYVGNDLRKYGEHPTDYQAMQRTCMPDWFAVMNFKQLIMYEVPPLANHSACFFSDDKFNCMCKDKGCNEKAEPSLPAAPDAEHYTCHKMACETKNDTKCQDSYLGTDMCVGQMCYYLKTEYDFQMDGVIYNETNIVRDCMNYSHTVNPIDDLTFVTGFEFGKSRSVFYPCRGDKCNANNQDTTAAPPITTTKSAPTFRFSAVLTIVCSILLAVRS